VMVGVRDKGRREEGEWRPLHSILAINTSVGCGNEMDAISFLQKPLQL